VPRETATLFAAQLAAAIEAKGISQAEVARLVGCSPAAISEILRGTRSPSLVMGAKIAAALGIKTKLADYK
jgi:transcriptional regulator with XRE-family HTH domain